MTFLFTDIEGSTRLWEEHPSDMEVALERHDQILREAIEGYGGYVFSTAGDAFSAAFGRAGEAVEAARAAQEGLDAAFWPNVTPIRVRMGVHTGEAQDRGGDYFGPAVNRAARIMSAGHGGQILVSASTASLIDSGPLVDLGEHRLKDLSAGERLFQVGSFSFPALRTLETVRHNLPVERTTLVGRKNDIRYVAGLVGEHRLVTLLGIGGTGKTRLATAVAAELADQFNDGVWFVDLVPVGGLEEVAGAVATAAGLTVSGPDLVEGLLELISNRDMLVVLDNCEHITDEVADLVDLLLETTTGPKVLATSREPLQLIDERHVHVAPLSIDGDLAAPAVELFVAAAGRIGVWIEPALVKQVTQICVQLDGLPLAIELAAAQLRQYTVAELADRLDHRFEILAQRRRGRGRRQASLLVVLEDTWGMLDSFERELLLLLAAFPSGFAAAYAEEAARPLKLSPVGPVLAGLVDRSLVARDSDGRHRLLQTVKLFASDQWPAEDPDRYLELHTRWVLDRLGSTTMQDRYTSAALAQWSNEHYEDHRLAEDRLAASGRVDELTTLFAGLTAYALWTTAWRASVTIDRIERYLDQLNLDSHQEAVLCLHAAGAGLCCRRHDWIATGSDRAVALLRHDGGSEELAWGLIVKSWMTAFADSTLALQLLDEAETLATNAGASVIADLAALYRACHLAIAGRITEARDLVEIIHTRIGGRPFDRSWNEFLGLSAMFIDTDPARTRTSLSTLVDEVQSVYGGTTLPGIWHLYPTVAAAATGDTEATRQGLSKTEAALRDDLTDDGMPDLLMPPAALAWAIGDHDRARTWLTAIRHSPVPTHDFNLTIIYRQLRNQVGLLDLNPLEENTIYDLYQEATAWLTSL